MARATCLKLVMRHFAPSPTNDARRCCTAAAAGLRRARRIAAMRLCASCLFTSLKETVFTDETDTANRRGKQGWREIEGGIAKCITYTTAASVFAILAGMTANQPSASVKPRRFRHRNVPDGHTVAMRSGLPSSAEAGTEVVRNPHPAAGTSG